MELFENFHAPCKSRVEAAMEWIERARRENPGAVSRIVGTGRVGQSEAVSLTVPIETALGLR